MKRWAPLLLAISILSSCKPEDTSVIDVSYHQTTLRLSFFELSADTLDTGDLPPSSRLPDDTVSIGIHSRIGIGNETPPAQIAVAHLSVYSPKGALIQELDLLNNGIAPDVTAGDSIFTNNFTLKIPRKQFGTYRFSYFLLNTDGNSQSRILTLDFRNSSNHKPVISDVEAPDTVVVPPPGYRTLYTFSARVSDAEGLADIASVNLFATQVDSIGGPLFRLFDDGQGIASGDSVAGDGRYSLIVQQDSNNTHGLKYFFKFFAVDLSGAVSDTITKIVYSK